VRGIDADTVEIESRAAGCRSPSLPICARPRWPRGGAWKCDGRIKKMRFEGWSSRAKEDL
jgi:hypothetical protein